MGKLSTELLLCFINAIPTFENLTFDTTDTLNEIAKKYGQDIQDNDVECPRAQKTFFSEFHGTFSIGNYLKLSKALSGLYPSNDRKAQLEVSKKITQELAEIGCSHEDKMALAILATQNGGIQTNVLSMLSHLFEPWDIDTALQSSYGSRCANIYKEANKVKCSEVYKLNAIRDISVSDNSHDPDEEQTNPQLIPLKSSISFTTRYSLARIGNNFTYRIDEEEIEFPPELKLILITKIEAEFNKPVNEINIDPDRLMCLAAYAEIDEDLRNSIFKYKSIVEKLLVGVLKHPDIETQTHTARAQLFTLIAFARLDRDYKAILLKNPLFKELFKSVLKNSGAQIDRAQLASLLAFAETDTQLKRSIIPHLKKYTGLEFYKRIQEINPSYAQQLFLNEKYRHKLLLNNDGELNEEFFQYLTELVQQNLDPNSDSLLFAVKLCLEIVQDKQLIPKLVSNNKFGNTLFIAPGEGWQKLAEATPNNILGEITKYSGPLIRSCLANSTLRNHFNEKMARCIDKHNIEAALENPTNHVGLMTYVLLKDRKQFISTYKKSNIKKAIATQFSKGHENAQAINTSCLFTAALEFQSLALQLLKKIDLSSADKAQIMLNHPHSKKIAQQIFQRYSWPKRWCVTSPCYKLAVKDLLICYLCVPEARRLINTDKKLLQRLFVKHDDIATLVQEKLTKEKIIALYANNIGFRELVNENDKLHNLFLNCYDSELANALGVKNKHIAALYLLYPALRRAILLNSYLASRLFNNTDRNIVNALLETEEFQQHATDDIKEEMQQRITHNQNITNLSVARNKSSIEKLELIASADGSNTNIHAAVSKLEDNTDANKVGINWKKSLAGFKISENVLNAVCSLGIYSSKLAPEAAATILQQSHMPQVSTVA